MINSFRGKERDESWVDVSADISEFAGEEVTVTFEAADGATLSTEYVGVLADSTGSGLPDAAEELDLHMPPAGEGRYLFSPLNLDPTVADTEYDGLRDGDEVDIATDYVETESGWQLRGIVTGARAHPFRTETDDDGLTDYEEAERWGTDPLLADTSGDGFSDAVDPSPLEKTTLPDVRYKSNDWYRIVENELIVEARPTGGATHIEEITVEKHVNSNLWWGAEWQSATVRDTDTEGAWLEKTFYFLDERKGAWGEPDQIIVTVEDEDGNTIEIDHDLDTGQSAIAAGAASAGAFATVTKPALAFPVTREAVIGITVGLGLGTAAYVVATAETIEGEETEAKLERPVPETKAVDTWTLGGEGMEITLPSGAVYESVGDHDRGFGWEYIKKTPDLRLSAVWNTIQNPEDVIGEDGSIRIRTNRVIIVLYYHSSTMEYANVSVKFPEELDRELEQFLEETGVYTNKSEFIKESVRRQLLQLNNEPAIAALRVEQLLARAETARTTDAELDDRLDELRTLVDDEALADAVDAAREETARQYDDRT